MKKPQRGGTYSAIINMPPRPDLLKCLWCGYRFPHLVCPECGLSAWEAKARIVRQKRIMVITIICINLPSLPCLWRIIEVMSNTSDKWRGIAFVILSTVFLAICVTQAVTLKLLYQSIIRSGWTLVSVSTGCVGMWAMYLYWVYHLK